MKQKIINGFVIVVICAVFIGLLFPWPKEFNAEFVGIKYQLGQENQNYSELVKVSFAGEYHKSYFGLIQDRFRGNIYIDGVDIYKDNEFEIRFDESGSTLITHNCFIPEQRTKKAFYYGKLYINEALDSLVIELTGDYSSSSIDRQSGYIIAAPAENKTEAMELVGKFIGN